MFAVRLYVLLIVLVSLTGCGGRAILGPPLASGAEPKSTESIYLATTRDPSGNPSLPYSSGRSMTLNFAKLDIGIPRNHVSGRVETSSRLPNPARHFAAQAYRPIDGRLQFIAQLDAALAQRAPEDREIVIFIHGYNNNIADSVFRNAQIAHDYNIRAVSLHYAWPSGGSLPLYVFDRDSAIFGRAGLAEAIEIAGQTKARRVLLVGHSMGSYVVMEALRDLAMTGRRKTLGRIGGVVLAAPDIDVDVFQSQMRDIGTLPKPFTIVVSRRDRALGISRRLAGGHARVGSGSDIPMLQENEIAVVDASDIDGGTHNVFASSPALMDLVNNNELMRSLLRDDQGPANQASLADGASVFEGAASLVVFLPTRILGGMALAATR
ncbi:alpha/beta fold hydrolase [Sinorhizobium sp. RAC02]|uniref:alpha/beta hydrolase n=1 Tax=Sinorhizobium sp. RAC02 TaxID=1842534 RepID=UPI00083E0EA2|nr:alpha/beta fold hydrolase [Sinorhizobium sp. RAC02]AOF90310.1 cholesterol acyltransferase family protein [Sinorhizobium sp. RAC02]